MPTPFVSNGLINLEQQRKRAKELLHRLKNGSAPDVLSQLQQLNPTAPINLASAQWLIAQELGFRSWPKLKAHVDAIAFAARHPGFAADDESNTVHWRCGNDIEHPLRLAGFRGVYRTLTDPLCMGPVRDVPDPDYRLMRCEFIHQAFGIGEAEVFHRFDAEYAHVRDLSTASHSVLWCEADPYDQLFLVRLLASLPHLPPHLELIALAHQPGVKRFIGLGQLSPDVLAWLWPQRQPVTQEALKLAQDVWSAWCDASPLATAQLARHDHPALPFLSAALRRLLLELPAVQDGLSLTERLALHCVAESGAVTRSALFNDLNTQREPLPFLGDIMLYAVLRPLIDGPQPLLSTSAMPGNDRQPVLRLTPLGERVLQGKSYWLDHAVQPRWLGGVCITPRQGHWAIESEGHPVWRT